MEHTEGHFTLQHFCMRLEFSENNELGTMLIAPAPKRSKVIDIGQPKGAVD